MQLESELAHNDDNLIASNNKYQQELDSEDPSNEINRQFIE
jgi:hypothetical protein